jgi:prepilin-type N-terminal cleavage/methylation domain-containing protein
MPLITLRIREHGFSLLEMAVVLAIIAVLSIGALTVLRAQSVRSQQVQTRDQLTETREALINFAIATKFLPCPARNDQGIADCTIPTVNGVRNGRLPWNTLGISSSDLWGNALYYKVTAAFTSPIPHPAPPIPAITLSTTGEVDIWDGAAQMNAPDSVAFAIWSSGEDQIDASAAAAAQRVEVAAFNDDFVTWVSRFVLIGRMLEAGAIP